MSTPTDDALPEKGRELDALVAEKVMGLVVIRSGWPGRCDVAQPNAKGTAKGMPTSPCPAYSTSIADAWRVVERLNSDRWYVCVDNDADGGWHAHVGKDFKASAPTAPEAICHAALRALSGDQTP